MEWFKISKYNIILNKIIKIYTVHLQYTIFIIYYYLYYIISFSISFWMMDEWWWMMEWRMDKMRKLKLHGHHHAHICSSHYRLFRSRCNIDASRVSVEPAIQKFWSGLNGSVSVEINGIGSVSVPESGTENRFSSEIRAVVIKTSVKEFALGIGAETG